MLLVDTEERARARLSREFPRVPARVIADVLSAYCSVTPSLKEAVRAARDRIADASSTA